ncbi:MAG TPA: ABC transporter permease subunit [Dermatophilaceae bacterium]|nr:ABC transporter permease subunit [Dermatophilaceae bacterium]
MNADVTMGRTLLRRALQAEARKLGPASGQRWVAAALALAGMGAAWLVGGPGADQLGGGDGSIVRAAVASSLSLLPYAAALLASASVTGEAASGISRVLYAMTPTRWPALTAKALTAALVATVMALLTLLAGIVGVVLAGRGDALWGLGVTELTGVAAGGCLGAGALAIVGVAVGSLARRPQPAAMVLVAGLLLGPVVLAQVGAVVPLVGRLAPVFPVAAASSLVDQSSGTSEPHLAALALAAWAVGLFAVAVRRLRRADV